jgi:ParB family transcriptional regulator, chromosome partitioning protein
MSKSSKEAHDCEGKTNLLLFDPDKLKLVTDKDHKLYDPRVELDVSPALVASILYKGVRRPVSVWKDPETGETCVVDGRQRVKACREANKALRRKGETIKLVPAVVFRGNVMSAMSDMALLNEGSLAPTPLGRCRIAERLLAEGYTDEQVAILMHCSLAALKNYLALGSCTAVVKRAVEAGKVAPTIAYKMSRMEPGQQRTALEKMDQASVPGRKRQGRKVREAAGNAGVEGVATMRGKREVVAMRDRMPAWKAALDWVLGGKAPEETDPVPAVPLGKKIDESNH